MHPKQIYFTTMQARALEFMACEERTSVSAIVRSFCVSIPQKYMDKAKKEGGEKKEN